MGTNVTDEGLPLSLAGVGGHGGSGIHADLESRYREIIQRAVCYAVPEPRPTDPSPEPTKAGLDPVDSLSGSLGSPTQPVTDPLFISGYSPPLTDSARRRLQQQPQQQQQQPPQGGSQLSLNQEQPRLVEEVHVTKCAVCTIL